MIDILRFMANLSKIRPVFHSEADFQHAFAWELQQSDPGRRIRLEKPWNEGAKQNHLDIWAEEEGQVVAVELKYKTRGLDVQVDQEEFHLRDQAAQDLGRYDFLKDVMRLERMALTYQNFSGCAILLTNDSAYWKIPDNRFSVDAAFRLHEGSILTGTLTWGKNAGSGTIKNREQPILLSRRYITQWQDYSSVSRASYGLFRFLCFFFG